MPRTIDDKIVEMRFDNRDFEKNTKQSMATLDKLKTSLDMTDSERSLEKLTRTSDELTFSKASNSVDTFSVKLSAMSSVAVAAIGRITNSLIDMGEQLFRNLSGINEIRSGYAKYEENVGYQQTMSITSKLPADEMKALLEKLEWFSSETSFDYSALMRVMSSSISSGQSEVISQAAAIGTALWASLSGNSTESLNAVSDVVGKIYTRGMTREIWGQFATAKMDIPQIRQLFMETAEELGTLERLPEDFYGKNVFQPITEKAQGLKKSYLVDQEKFLDALTVTEWLTPKVYLKAMEKLSKFTDNVYDEFEKLDGEEQTFNIIRRLGDDVEDLGYKALKAGQETKTWSETWDYVKGQIGQGWSKSFEIVIGDFERARDFFSNVVESLYSIFVQPGDNRNSILRSWAKYTPEVEKSVKTIAEDVDKVSNGVEKTITSLQNARDIVIDIIRGNYGNGAVRVKALAEQYGAEVGRELQLVVNEVWKQWDGEKWSLNYTLLDELTANGTITTKTSEAIKEAAEAVEEAEPLLNGRDDFIDGLAAFGEGLANIFGTINDWLGKESVLKLLGLNAESLYEVTHNIAEWMRDFRDRTEDFSGDFVYPLVYNIKRLVEIVQNLVQPIKETFVAVGKGFMAAFFPDGEQSLYDAQLKLLGFLSKIKNLTDRLRLNEEQSSRLQRIMQGLFTPLRIIWKILTSIGDAVDKVLSATSKDLGKKSLLDKLLSIGEGIANIIIGFDEWLDKSGAINNFIVPAVQFISKALGDVWSWVKKLLKVDSDKAFPTFDDVFEGWQKAKAWIKTNIIEPLENFLGFELRLPTWDEITSGWEKAKGWIRTNIVLPFEELTGIDLSDIQWPTWDDIKKTWGNFHDWIQNNIISPIEDAFNIDLHWPTIEEIKDFFKTIWGYITGIFGKSDDGEAGDSIDKTAQNAEKRKEQLETVGYIFDQLLNFVKKLFETLGSIADYLGQNESINTAFKAGVFAVVLEFISRLMDSAYGFLNLNPIMVINEIADSLSSLAYAAAEKKQSEAVKNLAISVAILAGSMFVLSLLPTDKVRDAIAVIIELVAAMGAIAVLLNKLSKTGGNSFFADKSGLAYESTYSDLYSVGSALVKMAAAVGVLAVALRLVAGIDDPNKLRQSLMAIEELLMALVGVAFIINKSSTKLDNGQQIGNVSTTILAMALLVGTLASAVKKLSKIPNFTTNNEAFRAVEDLLFTVGAVAAAIAYASRESSGKSSKTVGPIIAVLLSVITIISVVAKIVTDSDNLNEDKFSAIIYAITAMLGGIAAVVAMLAILSKVKGNNAVNDPFKFIKTAIGISIIIQALSVMIVAVAGAIAIIASTTKGMSEEEVKSVLDILGYISVLFLALSGAAVIIAAVVGGMSNKLNTNKFIKSLTAVGLVIAAIGVSFIAISAGIRLMSESTGGAYNILAAAGAVAGVLSALAGVVFMVFLSVKAVDKAKMDQNRMMRTLSGLSILILALSAGVSTIILSMRVLSESTNGSSGILTSLAAAAGVIVALGLAVSGILAVTFSLSKYDIGNETFKKLLGLSILMTAIGVAVSGISLSLAVLSQNDADRIGTSLVAIAGVLAAVALVIFVVSAMNVAGAKASSVVGIIMALTGAVSILAVALGALTYAVGNEKISGSNGIDALWNAVGAIAALFGILTVVAGIASIPVITAGFTAVTGLLVGLGAASAGFATGVVLIVAALVLLKNAIYDIGENEQRFEKGVSAIFRSIANAFKENLPVVLQTIIEASDLLAKAFLETVVQFLANVNERIPDLIEQIMVSVFKLLDGLKGYIGPLVATIFDFLIELLEGVAYAINTRAGEIVAALLDIVASLISLTNTVISGVLSTILHILHLDGLADSITDLFTGISEQTIDAMADAGDDIIHQSEEIGKRIIAHSPRLAAYYEKYGKVIEDTIGAGTEGITETLSDSGDSISNLLAKVTGGNKTASTLTKSLGGVFNGNLDVQSLMSFGESAGINFSEGVKSGLEAVEVSQMFPSLDQFYNEGAKAAEEAQSGYAKALYFGLTTGKFKTLDEVKKYIEEHEITEEDGVSDVYNMISEGTIHTAQEAIAILDANRKKRIQEEVQKSGVADWDTFYKEHKPTDPRMLPGGDQETGNVFGRQKDIDQMVNAFLTFEKTITNPGEIPDDTIESLLEFRNVLSSFGWSEYKDLIKIIDYLVYPDTVARPDDSVFNALDKYYKEWSSAPVDAAKAQIAEAEKLNDEYVTQYILGKELKDALSVDTYAQDYRAYLEKLYGEMDSYRKEILMGALFEQDDSLRGMFLQQIKASADNGDYTLLKLYEYFNKLSEAASKRAETVGETLSELYSSFVFAEKNGSESARNDLDKLISDLSEKVPKIVELYNEQFGFEIKMPEADWSKIIGDPSSISQEQFQFLFSYMYLLGDSVSRQYIDGIIAGLNSRTNTPEYEATLTGAAKTIPTRFRKTLQIESPSKVGEEIGDFFMQGVANGITAGSSVTGDESADAGVAMWQRLKDAISAAVGFNLNDLSPVIRPILDLDNIIAGTSRINTMLAGQRYLGRGTNLGIGSTGYGDLQAIAQLNKTGMAQAIQESVLSQPVNQTLNNTFNIQSNDPNEVARRVSAILSNQVERKSQVWGPARATRVVQ